ncbi:MAG TPA: NADH-quinone oxidoreductase subunit C, partial [Candidatus Polarisedimenticolia bacterium]|nr:NADH-quinone oxidoreductase subunit C [Candidatus Polarisedimenticolia bacterium]
MFTLEAIKAEIEQAMPGATLEIVKNDSPSAQHSLWVDNASAVAVAKYVRDEASLRFDYASNVTGVDWPEM